MSVSTLAAAAEWLVAADPDPDHARVWLSSTNIIMLPLGRQFEAVKVPERLGESVLAQGVDGPVIRDGGGRCYFFLVPVGTRERWAVDGTECLGDTCYLTIPVPARTYPPGPFWSQQPDGSGLLVDPVLLLDALSAAALVAPPGGAS